MVKLRFIVLIVFLVPAAIALPAAQNHMRNVLDKRIPNILAKKIPQKIAQEATWELLLEKHEGFVLHFNDMVPKIKLIAAKEDQYGPSILRGIERSAPLFAELFEVVEEYIVAQGLTKDIYDDYNFEFNNILADHIANPCFVLIELGEESVSNELSSIFLPGYTRITELLLEIEEIVVELGTTRNVVLRK